MKINHNNLDVVAWYIYIRSGQISLLENSKFKASYFSRELIKAMTPFMIKNLVVTKDIDKTKMNFYNDLSSNLMKDNFDSIDKTLSNFFRSKDHESLNFKILPQEIEQAIKMFLNFEENAMFSLEPLSLSLSNEKNLNNFGLQRCFINELLREYIHIDKSIFVAICGDGSKKIMKKLSTCLERYGENIFEKEVHVSNQGKRQWVRLQYAHESHWDERNMDHYMNHPYHGVRISGSSVGLIFFKKKDPSQNIRDLKELVRKDLGLKSFPHVHFPDIHKEVTWMANASFNENSSNWMNYALEEFPKNFTKLFPEYRIEILNRDDSHNFCLDTGIVMALHGIRDTSDIDYISCGDTEKPIVNSRMESHDSQYNGYHKTPQDVIEDPNSHFFYKNIKFCTLDEIKGLKKFRSEFHKGSYNSHKDLRDIELIEKYLEENLYLVFKYKPKVQSNDKKKKNQANSILKSNSYNYLSFFKQGSYSVLKKIIPFFLRRILRDMYVAYLMRKKTKINRKIPYILG